MRITTATEVSANAAERWRSQYKDWADDDAFFDGTTKGSVNALLNSNPHTPEKIEEILNDGWSHPQCDSCGDRVDRVVEVRRIYEDGPFSLCADCACKAAALIAAEITK